MRGAVFERFAAKIAAPSVDECWTWIGANSGVGGYGVFTEGGRNLRAHRVAYEIFVGLVIDHICRTRACVNPKHLEPVTYQENAIRGIGPAAVNASKTRCTAGHAFDETNTYIRKSGDRSCRKCAATRQRVHSYNRKRRDR